jgi:hypothetical protein
LYAQLRGKTSASRREKNARLHQNHRVTPRFCCCFNIPPRDTTSDLPSNWRGIAHMSALCVLSLLLIGMAFDP